MVKRRLIIFLHLFSTDSLRDSFTVEGVDRSPDQLPSRSALPQPTISFTLGTPHPSDLDHSKCVKKWTSCLLQPTYFPRGSAVVLCKASQSLSVLPVTDSILGYCLSLWKASVIV